MLEDLCKPPGVEDIVMTCSGNIKVILNCPVRLEIKEDK